MLLFHLSSFSFTMEKDDSHCAIINIHALINLCAPYNTDITPIGSSITPNRNRGVRTVILSYFIADVYLGVVALVELVVGMLIHNCVVCLYRRDKQMYDIDSLTMLMSCLLSNNIARLVDGRLVLWRTSNGGKHNSHTHSAEELV